MNASGRTLKSPVGLLYAGLAATLVLCAALPWFWVPAGHVVAGIDNPPRIDFGVLVQATMHTWDPAPNGGISNFVGYGMYWPFLLTGAALQHAGWSAYAVSSLLLSIAMVAAGAGIFCFCRALGTGLGTAVALTVAYEFNFAHAFMAPTFHSLLAYAAIAWIPFVILRFSQLPLLAGLRLAASTALIATALTYVKINPPSYATLGIVFVVSLIAVYASGRFDMRRTAICCGIFLASYAALNAWWIYDFAASLHLDPAAVTAGSGIEWVSRQSSFSQVLALRGSWALDSQFSSNPYFTYADWYANPFVYAAMLLVPFAAYAAVLRYRESRTIRFLAASAVVLTILAAGYHPPFDWLFSWLLVHVPGMWLFREPLTKFDSLLLLTYTAILAVACTQIKNRFDKRIFHGILAVFTIGCVIGGWPLLNGTVVRAATQNSPSDAVAVPAYWSNFAQWANGLQGGGRIVMLPQASQYQFGYAWGYYGPDVDGSLLRHPYIDATASASYTDSDTKALAMQWYSVLQDPHRFDRRTFLGLTKILAIEYAVYRRDVLAPADQPFPLPESEIESRLADAGFKPVHVFGRLAVFVRSAPYGGVQPSIPERVAVVSGQPFFDPAFAGWGIPVFASESDLPAGFTSQASARRAVVERNAKAAIGVRGKLWNGGYGLELTVNGQPANAVFTHAFSDGDSAAFVQIGSVLARIENGKSPRWGEQSAAAAGTVLEGTPGASIAQNGTYALAGAGDAISNVIVQFMPDLSRASDITVTAISKLNGGDLGTTVLHFDPQMGPLSYEFPSNVALRFTFTPGIGSPPQLVPLRQYAMYEIHSEQPFTLSIPPSARFLKLPALRIPIYRRDSTLLIPVQSPQTLRLGTETLPPGIRVTLQFAGSGDAGGFVARPPFARVHVMVDGPPEVVDAFFKTTPVLQFSRVGLDRRTVWFVPGARGDIHLTDSNGVDYNGSYTMRSAGLIFLPVAYSNGWRLSVDGVLQPHVHANGSENAWLVPAGSHRFAIAFSLEALSERLRRAAIAFAIFLALAIVALRVAEIQRRPAVSLHTQRDAQ